MRGVCFFEKRTIKNENKEESKERKKRDGNEHFLDRQLQSAEGREVEEYTEGRTITALLLFL